MPNLFVSLLVMGAFQPLLSFASTDIAESDRDRAIERQLSKFHKDPKRAMNERPFSYDLPRGSKPRAPLFDRETVRSGRYLQAKDRLRQAMRVPPGRRSRAAWDSTDDAKGLLGTLRYTDLPSMEGANLLSAMVPHAPWSDTYWPIYLGQIAARYASSEFRTSTPWPKIMDSMLNSAPPSDVALLSPAEKYDLLVGDGDRTLTKAMLATGESYFKQNGKIEAWMGLCHGWAPASYMLPRPARMITVLAADGRTQIPFFPSDLKALGTLLWASAQPPSRFIGQRCNTKAPSSDAIGRITEPGCADTNPGTWHLAVVNQIGVAKQSFVMDATFDYEVWNQPVLSYRYTYFNPQVGSSSRDMKLKDATIPMSAYTNDRFKNYRSPNAKAVVGIAMDVTYVIENNPNHRDPDQPEYDAMRTQQYLYDLELDSTGHIIGGEWYTNNHPDFLWTPAPGARAASVADGSLSSKDWNGRTRIPENFAGAARKSSSRGQPLAAIVEALFRESSGLAARTPGLPEKSQGFFKRLWGWIRNL